MTFAPCELFIVGTPLSDEEPLSDAAAAVLKKANVVIGESRKRAFPLVRKTGNPTEAVFLLDNMRDPDREALVAALEELSRSGGTAVLFSDTGMPILFDPGVEVLAHCRRLGFRVRVVPGPTSWATAAAVSGLEPPFLVVGFPPKKEGDRERFLRDLTREKAQLVLMDVPYRFTLLLKEAARAFGPTREAFLAWEIGKPGERYLWGAFRELTREAEKLGLSKGEFILIVKGHL